MLKQNKWQIIAVLLVLVVLGLWTSSYLKSESDATIDNINFGSLVVGDELSKEDLQDHVVGVKYMGKW